MKKAIRCCVSCIFPCGALDVIRIVHSNGHVEEISGSIRAAEIMKLHPKHVLKKPSSPSYNDDLGTVTCPRIIILPPDAELKRGKIYFLMPVPPSETTRPKSSSRKKKNVDVAKKSENKDVANPNSNSNLIVSDRYLTEILSEKVKDRRRGRAGVWRPHLESISEAAIDHLL